MHQATGMILVQLGNARTHNLLLTEVARRVVVERGFARQLLDIQVR